MIKLVPLTRKGKPTFLLYDTHQAILKSWETRRKNGNDAPWNKGLTKELDSRVKGGAGCLNSMYRREKTKEDRELRRQIFLRLNRETDIQKKAQEAKRRKGTLNNGVFRRLNKDPEFIAKRLKGLLQKPTKPEKELISIIQEYKLPYKYVGDGSFILGNLNPDFINVNGKKQIIEVFGRVWHQKLLRNEDWKRSELGRIMVFNSYGFKTLIIWDDELQNRDKVLDKLINFSKET